MNNKYDYENDKEYLDYLEKEKKEAHLFIYDDYSEHEKEV